MPPIITSANPSERLKKPSNPMIKGKSKNIGYNLLFFNILPSTFKPLPANVKIMAKTKVISTMLDPNNVPSPNDGMPSMAELTAMNVSGKTDMTDMTINPTKYFDKRKPSAKSAAYLVAIVAPFMMRANEQAKIKIFVSINYKKYLININYILS